MASLFVPLKESAHAASFRENTLVLPSISVGNVGQLACDLILYNAKEEFQKVGYIRSRSIIPMVGNDAFDCSGTGNISVGVEVFQSKEKKITIIQQRARFVLGRTRTFAKELVAWAKSAGFKQIILLAGADSGFWNGNEIVYRKCFYTSKSQEVDTTIFDKLNIERLEAIRADSIELFKAEATSPNKMIYPAARAGLLNKLHEACEDENLDMIGIVLFCKEGHNVDEGLAMATIANYYANIIPPSDSGESTTWKAPPSWKALM
mmetsp:Transcript_3879/g.4726  ORF Transcript_3879/g.4726 Transcript_3879/m.4726 type:complete len:263 (-) Transcript_3879:387-1175(-)